MADQSPGSGSPSSTPRGGPGGSTGGGGGGGGSNRNRNRNRNRSRSGGGGGGGQSGNRSGGGGGQRSGGGGGGRGGGNNRGAGQSGNRSGGGSSSRSRNSAPRAVALAPEPLAPRIVEPGLGAPEVLPAEVAANRRRATSICVAAGVVPGVVIGLVLALIISIPVGAGALVVVALVGGLGLWRVAPGVALRQVGAVALAERDHPRLVNVTEGLCATFGLRMPEFYVVFDAVPNACALGRDDGSAALVVTSGLLDVMGPIELEGVVAHELAHVKRHDNGVSVIGLTLARFAGEGALKWCVGKSREYRADIVGASAVRFPRGLLDALRLMQAAAPPAGNSIFSPTRFGATRLVWIDPSVGQRDAPVVIGDLNATSVRAAALSEW